MYSAPPHYTIMPAGGVQRGDPLGPLLFFPGFAPSSVHLKSQFYLGDATIGGTIDDILHDFEVIKEAQTLLGLALNNNKSQVICKAEVPSSMPGAKFVPRLPLSNVAAIDATLREDFGLATDR